MGMNAFGMQREEYDELGGEVGTVGREVTCALHRDPAEDGDPARSRGPDGVVVAVHRWGDRDPVAVVGPIRFARRGKEFGDRSDLTWADPVVLGPTREEQRTLALNSVEASFIDESRRIELEAEIKEWYGSV